MISSPNSEMLPSVISQAPQGYDQDDTRWAGRKAGQNGHWVTPGDDEEVKRVASMVFFFFLISIYHCIDMESDIYICTYIIYSV